jgi:menaquinol-cytochrome c reductase iron-sulfur subunit
MTRRDFQRLATVWLGTLFSLVLAVPGVGFILSPLWKKGREQAFESLTRLKHLEVGVPRSFAIIEERRDAWIKYPREPVGSVWLIRQAKGASEPVIALSSECPHLGCAVNLGADGKSFHCPCHTSSFELDGTKKNSVPPRNMDRLEVKLTEGDDPEVRIKFRRFRTLSERQIPLD